MLATGSNISDAFFSVCKDAKPAIGSYVCLMQESLSYGGPEEGGLWVTDCVVAAYQYFQTAEAAEAARVEVERLAAEQTAEAERLFGLRCAAECDWLDERGLDADFLPEVGGPDKFYVLVTVGLPENSYGTRQYS